MHQYNMSQCVRRYCLIRILTVLCILTPQLGVHSADSTTEELSLSQIWSRDYHLIKLHEIKNVAMQLQDDNEEVRDRALEYLKAASGLEHILFPQEEKEKWDQSVQRWLEYSNDLEVALSEKIPVVLSSTKTFDDSWKRALAVMFLGESAPHQAFIPLLRAIFENPKEDWSVRYKALTAISQIPHEEMVQYLIDQLDTDLRNRALEQLEKVTGFIPQNGDGSILNDEQVKQRYREWWDQNKMTFKYVRIRVLIEY